MQNEDNTPYHGHAGGVAVSSQFLFVTSDHTLFYAPLDALVNAENETSVQFTGSLPMETRGSFTKVADGVLWVGEFAFSGSYLTREKHHLYNRNNVLYQGWMMGYELDPATGFIPVNTPLDDDGQYVPDYILSIPYRIQGMSISQKDIVLSQSYGRTADSHLFIYNNPLGAPPISMWHSAADKCLSGFSIIPSRKIRCLPRQCRNLSFSKTMTYIFSMNRRQTNMCMTAATRSTGLASLT
ncbi:hypothetical protein RWE15_05455 [Virgibacillus halophilus]|uniref:Uncharacterized protein n=1 Tax=Tigheibacillus halophilus TaxID=361280 RepID=A0ABU5C4A3_9BACI|nr:hypothetical protein [Virgibacillus halophilus]